MANENPLQEFLQDTGLVLRLCGGAITLCDGDCENCDWEDDDEICND